MTVYTAGPCGEESNYSYIIVDTLTKTCAVTDPSECFDDVCKVLEENSWTPTHVLTTHHHWDHAAGNQKMVDKFSNVEVVGGDADEVEACKRWVHHKESFHISDNINVVCLNTPGHTAGHMCYLVAPASSKTSSEQAIFTGDCMFVGGCGRVFEGTYANLWTDLTETIGSLKPETRVFVGHEYTIKNLEFGLKEDPNNQMIKERLEWAKTVRAKDGVTVPTTVAEEWKTNIFLRCCDPMFQKDHQNDLFECPKMGLEGQDSKIKNYGFELFSVLRKRKDGNLNITTEMLITMPGVIPGKIRKAQKNKAQ